MQLPQERTLLRVFIGEADKCEGKPLYEWIVDTQNKLDEFLEVIEQCILAGLVTLEKAQIKFYRFEP